MANWGKKIRHRFSKKQEYTEVSAYKISKFTRREIIMTIVTVLAITSFALGTSYAIFSDVETSSNYNIVESGNLEIAFDHTEDGIGNVLSLNNAYPMSDSDGLLQTGYTFKVTNTGTLDSDYSVKILDDEGMIEADGCASNLLDKSKIKVSIDGSTPVLLSGLEASNWVIQTGKLKTNEVVTHTIRMWIDINSGNEVLGKHYHGKILVTATNDEPPIPTDESCFTFASGTITGYSSDPSCPKDVVIPETINGEAVTEIGEMAFGYMSIDMDSGSPIINPNYVPITGVVIPDSVIEIGNGAFAGEVDYDTGEAKGILASVVIGSGVTTIEGSAFSNNQLTEVVIPDSVTTLELGVFSNNQLTEVVIPDSVITIGNFAFSDNQLTKVMIGNSVTTIGNYVFARNQLTKILIPDSVTIIGASAFYNNQLTEVVIPDSVITIGNGAFYENQLTEVVIPNSVTSIGNDTFRKNQLTEVVIPNSVITIGAYAFTNNQLTEVVIPNSVTSIGYFAFDSNQLAEVVIGNGVTTIGNSVFSNNPLNTIRILGKSSATDFVSLGLYWNGTCTNIIYEP